MVVENTFLGFRICFFLQQPTTTPITKKPKTVVGLRLSNHWEPQPPPTTTTTNSKLHDRAEIEQYYENKVL